MPTPEAPAPLAPICRFSILVDLRFYFREDKRLPCPFPIVKAISVRPQYFKEETKQSICVGNQKSPLVSLFSKERGLCSPSSRDLPSPPHPLGPLCHPAGGQCLCLSVVGSHLAPLLSACFCFFFLCRMVILKSLGVLGQRQAGTSPGAPGLPRP